jgi:hypothetical protein
MRAIDLVLVSIAIMALLLTDADAKRRSSAQGSQAAGASRSWCATYSWKGINDNCSFATQNSVWPRCGGSVAFADPIRFPGRRMGAATPGQVRCARAPAGSPPVMLHRSASHQGYSPSPTR